MILPKVWPDSKKRPVCIHLAGTGDHVCICVFIPFLLVILRKIFNALHRIVGVTFIRDAVHCGTSNLFPIQSFLKIVILFYF